MEQIGNKIRRMILKKFNTIKEFYDKLVELNGDTAINRFSLTRILKNRVIVRERSLLQIAHVLLVRTSSLREGTDQEKSPIIQEEAGYKYNDKAKLKILENKLPFVIKQLTLKKGGRTDIEQDAKDKKESLKWIYILIGKVKVVVKGPSGLTKKVLHKRQRMSFDGRLPHHFENLSGRTSMCLIIHYPAENSIFY